MQCITRIVIFRAFTLRFIPPPKQRLKDDVKSNTFVWELNVCQTQALISWSLSSQ